MILNICRLDHNAFGVSRFSTLVGPLDLIDILLDGFSIRRAGNLRQQGHIRVQISHRCSHFLVVSSIIFVLEEEHLTVISIPNLSQ